MIRVDGQIIYIDELSIEQLTIVMEVYEDILGLDVDTARLHR